ncbi:MAG TPA: hypothetical protein VKI45_02360 [Allosphingosinicella sp.]|nr:hypothetical protein [Allosphingosinicella sp.]
MKLTTLAAAAAAILFTGALPAAADAQPMRERTVVRTTVVQRGHHAGWRNHQRRKVCRVTIRRHARHRVCTWR